MMRFVFFQIILLFLLFLSSSCSKNEYAEEIRSLDSLYSAVILVETQMEAIDVLEAKSKYETIINNIETVQKGYKDTLDFDTGIILSDYRSIRKPFNRVHQNKDAFLKELIYTKSQIKNLIADLEKGIIPPEKVSEYYLSEFNSAKEIHFKSELLVEALTTANNQFEELHPKVQEFVDKNISQKAVSD